MLFEEVNSWMKNRNVAKMEVKVYKWNKNAIKFYNKQNCSENYISYLKDIK